jgi:hypothetical protein
MLQKFKKVIESSRQSMNVCIANYKIVTLLLEKYEGLNLSSYADGNGEKMILTETSFKEAGSTDELIQNY